MDGGPSVPSRLGGRGQTDELLFRVLIAQRTYTRLTKTTQRYYHKGGDDERLQLAPALADSLGPAVAWDEHKTAHGKACRQAVLQAQRW